VVRPAGANGALLVAMLLAGCSPEKPTGFGVNVRVLSSALPAEQRGRIVSGRLTVVGDSQSPFVAPLIANIGGAIGGGELRFRYIPAVHSGKLALTFEALDANEQTVISGSSDSFDVLDGKAVDVDIPLGTMPADLSVPVDAGSDDGASDGGPPSDLRQLGCAEIINCLNACSSETCQNNCVSFGTASAKTMFNAAKTCLISTCMMALTDAGVPCPGDGGSQACSDCNYEAQTGKSPTGQMGQACMPDPASPYCGKCVDELLTCGKN
jgi:hypothetical protein